MDADPLDGFPWTDPDDPEVFSCWNAEGVIPLEVDQERIERYAQVWKRECGFRDVDDGLLVAASPGGWPDCTPYMRHAEILELVAPAMPLLEETLGEPAGVHLNLTGWVSTERDWHQDSYLNPPHVGDYYAALWLALGDIHPDSGPFQYVPGSHFWPQVTREAISKHVDIRDPMWPKRSEKVLTPHFERMIMEREAEVITHLPRAGEGLLWHGRLLHRGSRPNVPGTYRPAFIAHFSGINHRQDMPPAVQHESGAWYFPIRGGPVR